MLSCHACSLTQALQTNAVGASLEQAQPNIDELTRQWKELDREREDAKKALVAQRMLFFTSLR